MRRMLFIMGFVFILVSGIAYLVGCDNESTGPKLLEGDPEDPSFEFVSDVFDGGYANFSSSMLSLTFALIDSIPGMQGPARTFKPLSQADDFASIEYVYSYNDFWHIFTASVTMYEYFDDQSVDTIYFNGIDSVKFANAEGPMQYPDPSTISATIIWHFNTVILSSGDEIGVTNDASLTLTGLYEGDLTINGLSTDEIHLYVSDEITTCAFEITSSQEFDNIFIDAATQETDGCPTSGRLDVEAAFVCQCEGQGESPLDSLNIDGTWNISFVFDDGFVTITYVDGISRWTITEECGVDPGGPAAVGKAIRELME
ncbi:MAG: hypothetical protein JSV44_03125 [Candidatus Zixiibacteriota bacterium]|nr:MAG: hypothetical protein JSV44_03125 [candidate division Zixibacteria bacterium]